MTNDWRKKYDSVDDFHEGFARVKLEGKWGFVDVTGTVVIPLKYDYVEGWFGGFYKVKLDDKLGWITKEGKELLLTKDQHIQIKNLIELEKITEEELINWVKEQMVK